MQIKKKKVHSGEHATTGENGMGEVSKKQSAMPMGVSAALSSLKKQPVQPTANGGQMGGDIPSAKTSAMDTGHSEAYKEKIKKRVK